MTPPCPPFSPCWCETRPNHPRCQETPALPISNMFFEIGILLLITILILKSKKYEK